MYAGEMLEEAPVADLFARPLHPYTVNLLHCVPRLGASRRRGLQATVPDGRSAALPGGRLATLPGGLPPLPELPRGCIFAPRCPLAGAGCSDIRPPLAEAEPGHLTACIHWRTLTGDEGQRAAVYRDETEAELCAQAVGTAKLPSVMETLLAPWTLAATAAPGSAAAECRRPRRPRPQRSARPPPRPWSSCASPAW